MGRLKKPDPEKQKLTVEISSEVLHLLRRGNRISYGQNHKETGLHNFNTLSKGEHKAVLAAYLEDVIKRDFANNMGDCEAELDKNYRPERAAHWSCDND